MIGATDSYLQLVAALYISICIENTFCSHIWHPKFSGKTRRFLNENEFWKKFKLIERIQNTTDHQFDVLAKRARQRGGFMLAVCVILILYTIFENDLSKGMPAEALSILAFLVSVFLISLLQLYFNFNFIGNACGLAISIGIYSCFHHYFQINIWNECYNPWVTLISLSIISFPLLYQFVWHRLTNSFFMLFWENALSEEEENYKRAKDIEENGGNPKTLPSEYSDYFAICHVNKQDNQDLHIKGLNECFFKRLEEKCQPPGLIHLLYFRICKGIKSLWGQIRPRRRRTAPPPPSQPLKDYGTPIQSLESINDPDKAVYEPLYQLYSTSSPIPKLKAFCKEHDLDEKLFRVYFKQRRSALRGQKKGAKLSA